MNDLPLCCSLVNALWMLLIPTCQSAEQILLTGMLANHFVVQCTFMSQHCLALHFPFFSYAHSSFPSSNILLLLQFVGKQLFWQSPSMTEFGIVPAVFMGMGEFLLNLPFTLRAHSILNGSLDIGQQPVTATAMPDLVARQTP